MNLHAGRERALVGVEPFERRQQRRMDVQHAPLPAADEPGRQEPQEAGEADEIDPVRLELGLQRPLEAFAILAEAGVVHHGGGDIRGARNGQPRGVRTVG